MRNVSGQNKSLVNIVTILSLAVYGTEPRSSINFDHRSRIPIPSLLVSERIVEPCLFAFPTVDAKCLQGSCEGFIISRELHEVGVDLTS